MITRQVTQRQFVLGRPFAESAHLLAATVSMSPARPVVVRNLADQVHGCHALPLVGVLGVLHARTTRGRHV